MTLDIRKLMKNTIEKQFKISHLDNVEAEVFTTKAIPENIVKSIQTSYGEEFLEDAAYVAFFKTPGPFDKKLTKRLFNAVDSALGNDANRLADGDFKRLELGKMPDPESVPGDDEQEDEPEAEIPEPDMDVPAADDAPEADDIDFDAEPNDAEIEAALDSDPEDAEPEEDADQLNEDDEDDSTDDEDLDIEDGSDDGESDVDSDDEDTDSDGDGAEEPEEDGSDDDSDDDSEEDDETADKSNLPKTAVFLKITTK